MACSHLATTTEMINIATSTAAPFPRSINHHNNIQFYICIMYITKSAWNISYSMRRDQYSVSYLVFIQTWHSAFQTKHFPRLRSLLTTDLRMDAGASRSLFI